MLARGTEGYLLVATTSCNWRLDLRRAPLRIIIYNGYYCKRESGYYRGGVVVAYASVRSG